MHFLGWSGGAIVLGKVPVPGPHTNLDESRTRVYCPCSQGLSSIRTQNFPFSETADCKFVHVHLKCFSLKVHTCQVS